MSSGPRKRNFAVAIGTHVPQTQSQTYAGQSVWRSCSIFKCKSEQWRIVECFRLANFWLNTVHSIQCQFSQWHRIIHYSYYHHVLLLYVSSHCGTVHCQAIEIEFRINVHVIILQGSSSLLLDERHCIIGNNKSPLLICCVDGWVAIMC